MESELFYPTTQAEESKLSSFYPELSTNPSLVTCVGHVKVNLSRELEDLDLVKFIERAIVSSSACVLMGAHLFCQSTFQ